MPSVGASSAANNISAAGDLLGLLLTAMANRRAQRERLEEQAMRYRENENAQRRKLAQDIEDEIDRMNKKDAELAQAIEDELSRQQDIGSSKEKKGSALGIVGFWSGTFWLDDPSGSGLTFFRITQQRSDGRFIGLSNEGDCVGSVSIDRGFRMRCGNYDYGSEWNGRLSEDGRNINGTWVTTTITNSENNRSRGRFSVDFKYQ